MLSVFALPLRWDIADPKKDSQYEKEAIVRRYTTELVRRNFIGPAIVSLRPE